MPATVKAVDFLASPRRSSAPAVCVVYSDEPLLRSGVLEEVRRDVLGAGDGEFCESTFDGETTPLRDVLDELSTPALFGSGRRLVVVDDADGFVSRNRAALESYVARPAARGVLVLVVNTWPANTKLYRAIAQSGLQVECKPPAPGQLRGWVQQWAERRHGIELDRDAAETLIEIAGKELGLLDRELAKLAASFPPDAARSVTAAQVGQLVASWKTKTIWEILDATLAGNAAEAITHLDRLLVAGEAPVAILGPIGFTLRRLAAAARIAVGRHGSRRQLPLRQALEQAGFAPFLLAKAESQLRRLGRDRAARLYRWLLDADLTLKGASQLPPRLVLEQLIARLAYAE